MQLQMLSEGGVDVSERREAFKHLVTMLYKLQVTNFYPLPVMSNPYNLVELSRNEFMRAVIHYKLSHEK
jgi:hypothetical protein